MAKDHVRARALFEQACKGGDAAGCSHLGVMFEKGEGGPQDLARARTWYAKAAEQRYAPAQHNLGLSYANPAQDQATASSTDLAPDHTRAAEWFAKAAEQGYAPAQNDLGLLYTMGRGVAQDHRHAAAWFAKAAEQGHVLAQHNLASAYAMGRGVQRNTQQAVAWYTKAAEAGYAPPQYELGNFYADIGETQQHRTQAERDRALVKAAEGARTNPGDFSTAANWYRQAAEQGHVHAQVRLGYLYGEGWGVPQSWEQAAHWIGKAAAQGNAEAQFLLGFHYDDGKGVPQSHERAAEWYRRAAEQGHLHAQNNLAVLHRHGRGVPRSEEKARMWFARAADKGSDRAQANLARPSSAFGRAQREPEWWEVLAGVLLVAAAADIATGARNTDVESERSWSQQRESHGDHYLREVLSMGMGAERRCWWGPSDSR